MVRNGKICWLGTSGFGIVIYGLCSGSSVGGGGVQLHGL